MTKNNEKKFRTLCVPQSLYDWLKTYMENKRLRSFNQAIEWLIMEAGYDLSNPSLERISQLSAGEVGEAVSK
jgi:hypothetical protein